MLKQRQTVLLWTGEQSRGGRGGESERRSKSTPPEEKKFMFGGTCERREGGCVRTKKEKQKKIWNYRPLILAKESNFQGKRKYDRT